MRTSLVLVAACEGRVVGYIPDYRMDSLQSIDYSALTHAVASFLVPGADGHFTAQPELGQIVAKAKSEGVSAFVAIGGGGADVAAWKGLMSAGQAEATAQRIVSAVLSLGAGGVDVDLEGDLVLDESYNSFVATLAKEARAHGLGLSAALAKWSASLAITDATLQLFDFVNLMCYDYKGPWDTTPPLQHSPFDAAQDELNYYINERHLPSEKVVLGVPFYGYDFADSASVQEILWSDIVRNFPGQLDSDNVGSKYFNGRATIHRKAALAKSMGAGVMIWELGQDVQGPNSLLLQVKTAMGGMVV